MTESAVAVREEIKPLSANEAARLGQLQKVIVDNFQSFVKVGQALAEIRDRELYREEFRTFERYCKHVFDIARGTAYRYIAAAEVVSNVSKLETSGEIILMIPANEAQVRPLSLLKPDQQMAVWKAAVESAPKGKVTASHVAKVVKGYMGQEVKSKIRNAREKVDVDQLLGAEFKEKFQAFADQIEAARNTGYKTTSRLQIIYHLDALRGIVAEDGVEVEDVDLMSDDRHKLLAAGFHLFRTDGTSMSIKEYRDSAWHKHSGPFESMASLVREFKAIMKNPMNVRG